jgi:hypothetical protein
MTWTYVVLAAVLPTIVLTAWALWLLFNYLIAKHHGIAGLEATPPVAKAFQPRDWAILIARKAPPPDTSPLAEPDPSPADPPPALDADDAASA